MATLRLEVLGKKLTKYNPAILPVVTVTGVGPEALRPQLPLRFLLM